MSKIKIYFVVSFLRILQNVGRLGWLENLQYGTSINPIHFIIYMLWSLFVPKREYSEGTGEKQIYYLLVSIDKCISSIWFTSINPKSTLEVARVNLNWNILRKIRTFDKRTNKLIWHGDHQKQADYMHLTLIINKCFCYVLYLLFILVIFIIKMINFNYEIHNTIKF